MLKPYEVKQYGLEFAVVATYAHDRIVATYRTRELAVRKADKLCKSFFGLDKPLAARVVAKSEE